MKFIGSKLVPYDLHYSHGNLEVSFAYKDEEDIVHGVITHKVPFHDVEKTKGIQDALQELLNVCGEWAKPFHFENPEDSDASGGMVKYGIAETLGEGDSEIDDPA